MSNTSKRVRFLWLIGQLLTFAEDVGYELICAWFYRTPEEQAAMFQKGLSKCDGVIKKSAHQQWLAMDLYLVKDDKLVTDRCMEYEDLGQYWRGLGGVWEPIPGDIYHFEYGGPDA